MTDIPVAEGQIPAFPDLAPAFDSDVETVGGSTVEGDYTEDEIKTLVPITDIPATHHLVVGMGTLAAMSEEEFAAKLAVMKAGQERIRTIQRELLTEGEDYGRVKGIERPFLHQPGAEKLGNFYGFAVRQEAERIIGRKAMVRIGDTESESGEWLSPPLAYHVRSYVHLGDFSGPVVAQGYGEASSWEEKHRYRWAKAICPTCNREGLIKGKPDGQLKGKYWCPKKEGGCNSTFEPADPRVVAPGKVENTDPHSLAETLLQMAAKRSHVAAIRRATGTSGLFTQDEDSPSVRQQFDANPYGDGDTAEANVVAGDAEVQPGAKTTDVTQVQLRRLVALSKEKDLGPIGIASLLKRLFDISVEETSPSVSTAVQALTAQQLGLMLLTIETGEVPVPTMPPTTEPTGSTPGPTDSPSGGSTSTAASDPTPASSPETA